MTPNGKVERCQERERHAEKAQGLALVRKVWTAAARLEAEQR
jgi:hypothetical protein